jgi:hypothetical protein
VVAGPAEAAGLGQADIAGVNSLPSKSRRSNNIVLWGAMRECHTAYQDFSTDCWSNAFSRVGLAEKLNACFECCDRWSGDGRVALEWISRDFVHETVTFRALQDAAARFANLLRSY